MSAAETYDELIQGPVGRETTTKLLRVAGYATLFGRAAGEAAALQADRLIAWSAALAPDLAVAALPEAGDPDQVFEDIRHKGPDEFIAHRLYATAGHGRPEFFLTDRIVLKSRNHPGDGGLRREVRDFAKLVDYDSGKIRFLEEQGIYVFRLTGNSPSNPLKISKWIREQFQDRLDWVEPDLHRSWTAAGVLEGQWHLEPKPRRIGRSPASSARVVEAWQMTKGAGIVVAVVDDGVDGDHPSLKGRCLPGMDLTPVSGIPAGAPQPGLNDRHGQCCATLIAAKEDRYLPVGVAPECLIQPARVPMAQLREILFPPAGGSPVSDVALAAFLWQVGRKAHVMSCSWGCRPLDLRLSQVMTDTLTRIATKGGPDGNGCVIVAAAMNYDAPLDMPAAENRHGFEFWDTFEQKWEVAPPRTPIHAGLACHLDVVCVGATSSMDLRSAYSNWGSAVGVCAPSDDFLPPNRHFPIDALGRPTLPIVTGDLDGGADEGYEAGPVTIEFGGTSASTAIVAGVAALVRAVNPELKAHEVRSILEETADRVTDSLRDPLWNGENHSEYDTPSSRVRFLPQDPFGKWQAAASGGEETTRTSLWFGHGRVNAARAVCAAAHCAGGKFADNGRCCFVKLGVTCQWKPVEG